SPDSAPGRARHPVKARGLGVSGPFPNMSGCGQVMRGAPARPPVTGGSAVGVGEGVGLALCALVLGLGSVVWAGAPRAALFSGGRVGGGLGDWLRGGVHLAGAPGDPAAAWGTRASGLPGPVVYWVCTAFVAVMAGLAVGGVVWGWRRWSSP